MSPRVLAVDAGADVAPRFRRGRRTGCFVMAFARPAEAVLAAIGDAREVTVVLVPSGISMPGVSGFDTLPIARAAQPGAPAIMATAFGDAAAALSGGAGERLEAAS